MKAFGESILDYLDLYKLTMLQFIWRRYSGVTVRFALTNRTTSIRLAEIVPVAELRESLGYVQSLSFSVDETNWLSTLQVGDKPMFCPDFLKFLETLTLPDFELSVCDGQFELAFEDEWSRVSLWETPALAQLVSCYTHPESEQTAAANFLEGERRLRQKAEILRQLPRQPLITEFGTRRRYSAKWHDRVFSLALELFGDLIAGTSNLGLARRHGVSPKGTIAHEPLMVCAALAGDDEGLLKSQNVILSQWWDLYGPALSIALTDTFGSEFSFRSMDDSVARNWQGTRQDSGDPHQYAAYTLAWYQQHHVDAHEKFLFFSDGLTASKIVELYQRWGDRIQLGFGWGTNLTNDLGIKPLSLVIKAVAANGRPTVKLSDNLAKAIGPTDEVERYRRIFGYTSTLREKCTY